MKLRPCEACTPELPCVLHTVLPPLPVDDDDSPVAQRIDHARKSAERKAPTRLAPKEDT